MKKILFVLVLFAAYTMNAYTPKISEPVTSGLLWEDGSHRMVVHIISDQVRQDLEFLFSSEQELLAFDLNQIQDAQINPELKEEDCKVSVTVKVSVGIGSNYVQASATVSGISCSSVASTIQRLRQQLMDAIK